MRTITATGAKLPVSSFGTPYTLFRHLRGREYLNEGHFE